MRSRKLTALLMTTALCATALYGCGGDDAKTTTTPAGENKTTEEEKITCNLKVWSPAEDQAEANGQWLQTMCEQFNTEHPNWTITFEYGVCSEGDAGKTVSDDVAASADVYMFASDQLKQLVDAEGLAKLGGETATYIQDTNSKTIVDSVSRDGAIYGIPFTTNVWFMYYDKSVFSEEDVKSLDTMLEKGKVSFPMEDSWYVQSFFLAAGCTMGSDDAPEIKFGGEEGLNAANYMIDLVNNANFIVDADGGVDMLQEGQANAAFGGSWNAKDAKIILGDNFACAQLPSIDVATGTGVMQAMAGSKAIGINPNCANQQVAVALAKYLASEEAQKSHYELRSVVPCNTALLEDETFKSDPVAVAQNASFDNCSILQPTYLGDRGYWDTAKAFAQAITSKATTSANVAEKVEELNEALKAK